MNKFLGVGVLMSLPLAALAGNTAAPSVRAGPSSVAPPTSQVAAANAPSTGGTSGASAPAPGVAPLGMSGSNLPGAYQAAIANGAVPAADGTVQVSLNGVPLTIDRENNIVPR